MDWEELDKVELSAFWIEGTAPERFAVERKHSGILRGHWEFEHVAKNEWRCTRAGAHYLREQVVPQNPDTRETDESRIPDDIVLKAKEFLLGELKLTPKRRNL